MNYNKQYFEKVFSTKRMGRYFQLHEELLLVMGWINQDIPEWIETLDRFEEVKQSIKHRMGWI